MNKVINQSGVEIVSVGTEYSHARNKEVFDITLPKLINKIWFNWNRGGLERHTTANEMYDIMNEDQIENPKVIASLYNSAYFYFDQDRLTTPKTK